MRTSSKIFAGIFAALGFFALYAAISGKTHQYAIVLLCALVVSVLLADATKKVTATEKS